MSGSEKAALRDAARSKKDDETFENALGRTMRRADLDYASYVKVIGMVRQIADKKGVSMVKAAKQLLRSDQES